MIRGISIVAAFVFLLLIVMCCINKKDISNTSWVLIEAENSKEIHFYDSTCIITEQLWESIDTTHARYSLNIDTIIFHPIEEHVFINSQLYRKGDTLYESKKHIPICVLKNK